MPISIQPEGPTLGKAARDTMQEAVGVGAMITWKLSSSFIAALMERAPPVFDGEDVSVFLMRRVAGAVQTTKFVTLWKGKKCA